MNIEMMSIAVPDGLIAPTDKQEVFSELYVSAIATCAGFTYSKRNLDRDGIDLEISAGGSMRPQIGLQLKSSFNLEEPVAGIIRYPLKVRNYDLLRMPTMSPRILILFAMPRDESLWSSVGAEELTLRKCAYWVNLNGSPETPNTATVTIDVPVGNILHVASLKAIMDRARKAERI